MSAFKIIPHGARSRQCGWGAGRALHGAARHPHLRTLVLLGLAGAAMTASAGVTRAQAVSQSIDNDITRSGFGSTASGDGSTAYGKAAKAKRTTTAPPGESDPFLGATAVGGNSSADGDAATAIGGGADARANGTVAIGGSASALTTGSVALGQHSEADGPLATAFGFSAVARNGGLSFGAQAFTEGGVAIGKNAHTGQAGSPRTGAKSIAIGDNAAASDSGNIGGLALGKGADATGGVAIGQQASAGAANCIALGNQSICDLPESVSIGSVDVTRRLMHVAAGAAPTDATNLVQLQQVEQVAKTGWNLSADRGVTNQNIGPGETVSFAAGPNTTVARDGATMTFGLISDPAFSSVAIGSTKIAGTGVTIASGPSLTIAGIDAGGKSVTGVAAGNAATDAATIGQLQAVGIAAANSVRYDDAERAGVTLGGKGGTRISNLAVGRLARDSTDAINGAQLYSTNQQLQQVGKVAGAGWNLSADGGITSLNVEPGSSVALAAGSNAVVTRDGSSITFGLIADPIFNSVIIGATKITGRGVTVANGPSLTTAGIDAGGKRITGVATGAAATDAATVGQLQVVGAAASNSVQYDSPDRSSVTLGGGDGTRIVNLAAGRIASDSTDAVNGAQLFATNQHVVSIGNRVTTIEGDISNVTGDVGSIRRQVTTNTTDISNLQAGRDGFFQVENAGGASKPVPSGRDSTAGGAGAVASGRSSTAIGYGARATGDSSVAIGDGSIADRVNSVSVGADGSERQVTHVAAGIAATDAANIGQLRSAMGNLYGYADTRFQEIDRSFADLDRRVDRLDRTVSKVRREAQEGTAVAIAMGNLQYDRRPGKLSLALAGGYWMDQGGIALGVAYTTPTARLRFNAGLAMAPGSGNVAAGAGMTLTLN